MTSHANDGIRDMLDHVLVAYEEIDRRFGEGGGLTSVLGLYERVRNELDRVSHEELDRMAAEIKRVVEVLLQMDYELRKVHELKRALEASRPGGPAAD